MSGKTDNLTWFLVYYINVTANDMFEGDRYKAYSWLKTSGALGYLTSAFESLHSQGVDYVMEVIEEFKFVGEK
jgi:hypothetical protein